MIQELLEKPLPLPRKAKLTLDSIQTNKVVIDYLKQKVAFESGSAFEIVDILGNGLIQPQLIKTTTIELFMNYMVVRTVLGLQECIERFNLGTRIVECLG